MSSEETPAKPKRTLRQRILFVLLMLVVAYVFLALAALVFQRKLIYLPTRYSSTLAETLAVKEGFKPWRGRDGGIIGWHLPSRATATGAVLVVHGNAGCALDRGYLAKPIHDAACVDVYILEYPGYGARTGVPNLQSLNDAGDEAFGQLSNSAPLYVVSESLGAGVATHLAQMHREHISGLLLFVPYNDFASVAQRQMLFLPVSLLLLDRFKPAESLRDYRGPVSIVLAGEDEVIPPELGRKLHDGYAGPKRLQVIPGAHHNDASAQSPEWWKGTFGFWQEKRAGAIAH